MFFALYIQDSAVFSWRYKNDSMFVADEIWQDRQEKLGGIGIPAVNPLPYMAAIWARLANVGILIVFVVFSFAAALLYEELVVRAAYINEECNDFTVPSHIQFYLDKLRHHYGSICSYVENIEDCFGLVLLLDTARTFSVSIYEFYEILLSRGRLPKYYFNFLHSIIRFFLVLVPSYLITQQVSKF